MTPKRKTKNNSKTSPKKSRNSTPKKSRSSPRSSRSLPKSPISQTMRQKKIMEFFKPISPALEGHHSSQVTHHKQNTNEECLPIRKGNTSQTIKRSIDFKDDIEVMDISSDSNNTNPTLLSTPNDSTETSHRSEPEVENASNHEICEKGLNELMVNMKIGKKQIRKKKSSQTKKQISKPLLSKTNSDFESNQVLDQQKNFDEMDVTIFKVPKPVPKPKNSNKQKVGSSLDYVLRNLNRINIEKKMLTLEPIVNYEDFAKSQQSVDLSDKSNSPKCDCSQESIGIESFTEYIPKNLSQYSVKQSDPQILSQNIQNLWNLSLNTLSKMVPIYMTRLDVTEKQQLVERIIELVTKESNLLTLSRIENRTIKILCANKLEISLSKMINNFYSFLSTNTSLIKNNSTDSTFRSLTNVIKILTVVINVCEFQIQGNSHEEELTKLLAISFVLGLEKSVIKDFGWFSTIQQLIAVIINRLNLNDSNISQLIEYFLTLLSSNNSLNMSSTLRIISMFPINVDISLKRKFCIVLLKRISSIDAIDEDFDCNLNDIPEILSNIDWSKLCVHQYNYIIQLVSTSFDLPIDVIDCKEIVTQIMTDLTHNIYQNIQNGDNLENSDIHKQLVILRTKISVCSFG